MMQLFLTVIDNFYLHSHKLFNISNKVPTTNNYYRKIKDLQNHLVITRAFGKHKNKVKYRYANNININYLYFQHIKFFNT